MITKKYTMTNPKNGDGAQPGPGGYIYRGFSMSTVIALSAALALVIFLTPTQGDGFGLGASMISGVFLASVTSFIVEMRRKREAGDEGFD